MTIKSCKLDVQTRQGITSANSYIRPCLHFSYKALHFVLRQYESISVIMYMDF